MTLTRGRVLDAILDIDAGGPTEKCILFVLDNHIRDHPGGWPSMATIAKRANCGETTARRCVRRLEARGLVTCRPGRGENGASTGNEYALNYTSLCPDPSPEQGPPPPAKSTAPPSQIDRPPSQIDRPPSQIDPPVYPGVGARLVTRASGSGSGEEKKREDKDKTPPPGKPPGGGGFARFWALWPTHHRKADKAACALKWRGLGLDEIEATVISGLKAWIDSEQWRKEAGQYIPAPRPWLNQRRWESPPPAAPKNAKPTHPTNPSLRMGQRGWYDPATQYPNGDPRIAAKQD